MHVHDRRERVAVAHEVGQAVAIEDAVKRRDRFGERALQATAPRDRAAALAGREALGGQVLAFGVAHHVAESDVRCALGEAQAAASISKGMWYARSPEIVHSHVMETLVWLRVPGDIVFAAGALLLAVYALKLLRRPAAEHVEPVPLNAAKAKA